MIERSKIDFAQILKQTRSYLAGELIMPTIYTVKSASAFRKWKTLRYK